MSRQARGRCLCGGVAYTVTGPLRDVWNCHCHRCRRTTGHYMAATKAAAEDVRLDADDTLTWYVPEDEPGVAYGFCNCCGGSVFWKATGGSAPSSISICAGTLDPPTGLATALALFADSAGDYHVLDSSVPSFPGGHPPETRG